MPAAAYRSPSSSRCRHSTSAEPCSSRYRKSAGRTHRTLISTVTGSGSALRIAGLLYSGATLALLGGVVGPLAWAIDKTLSQRLSLRDPLQIATVKAFGAPLP